MVENATTDNWPTSTGQAKAEAQSRAEAAHIEGEAAVEQAGLKARAANIEAESELERLRAARDAELKYTEESNQLEVKRAKEMANIEIEKFQQMVSAMGTETLRAMATAGGDHQVKMLQSLGLQSTLITDGRTPISLLNTAQGLIGLGAAPEQAGGSITRRHQLALLAGD